MQQCAGILDRTDQSREWLRNAIREGTFSTEHAAFGLAFKNGLPILIALPYRAVDHPTTARLFN